MMASQTMKNESKDSELIRTILDAVKTYNAKESQQLDGMEHITESADSLSEKSSKSSKDGRKEEELRRKSRKRGSISSSLFECLNEGMEIGRKRDSMSKHLFEYLNDGQQQNSTNLFEYLKQQQQQKQKQQQKQQQQQQKYITSHLDDLNDFDEYQRTDDVKIVDFVAEFDQKYQSLHTRGITFSAPALALKLLSKARLSKQERILVNKTIDFSKEQDVYEEAKRALLKISEYENLRSGFRDLQRSEGAQESSLNKVGEFYLILDSACSSTLCGKKWLDEYLEHIGEEMAAEVKCSHSEKMFVFGGGAPVKSLGSYRIPAFLAGKVVTITVDVVPNDLPLIFSLGDMKKAEVKLDFTNDTAEIYGQVIKLKTTDSGHYSVPIDGMSFKRRKRCRILSDEIRILEELVNAA